MSDCTTRRAVSTQLVGNPVCAHYRRHVTPGVCRRGGTLRRGFPRPEPRLVGSQARNPSACTLGTIRPRRVPADRLACPRACSPQSHVPVRERRCAAAREAGRTLRTARDRDQRRVVWRRCPAADQGRGRPPHRATLKAKSRAGGRGDPAGCAWRKLCPRECAVCGTGVLILELCFPRARPQHCRARRVQKHVMGGRHSARRALRLCAL